MPNTENASIRILDACNYFATEEIQLNGVCTSLDRGETFQILLAKSGNLTIETADNTLTLSRGQTALIPADTKDFTLTGTASTLMYYVPDIRKNIIRPLLNAGYTRDEIDQQLL
jgi:mannose-6-phosphate isomerase